jgi:hypothetical protein
MVGSVDPREVLGTAAELAEQGYLVTIGIKPSKAETGYGYIEVGPAMGTSSAPPTKPMTLSVSTPYDMRITMSLTTGRAAGRSTRR